jgi:hypothetical protein
MNKLTEIKNWFESEEDGGECWYEVVFASGETIFIHFYICSFKSSLIPGENVTRGKYDVLDKSLKGKLIFDSTYGSKSPSFFLPMMARIVHIEISSPFSKIPDGIKKGAMRRLLKGVVNCINKDEMLEMLENTKSYCISRILKDSEVSDFPLSSFIEGEHLKSNNDNSDKSSIQFLEECLLQSIFDVANAILQQKLDYEYGQKVIVGFDYLRDLDADADAKLDAYIALGQEVKQKLSEDKSDSS